MQGVTGRDQGSLGRGVFDAPRQTSVQASRQEVFFRFVVINVMVRTSVLVVTRAKADQYFVSPGPDSMIGRPTTKATTLSINSDVFNSFRIPCK